MKTKLNNILNANSWLFIELVIITVVAWVVLDPAVVNLYYRLMPLDFAHDQLLYAESQPSGEGYEDENGRWQSPYDISEERSQQMKRLFSDMEDVASVYPYETHSIGYPNTVYRSCLIEGDTLYLPSIGFVPDSRFFETVGLRPLPGSPSAEELSRITEQDNKVVLSRSGAIALFGTTDVVGRRFPTMKNHRMVMLGAYAPEPAYEVTVAGVVEDFRKSIPQPHRSFIIMPDGGLISTRCKFLIRLKDGIDAHRFVEEHGRDLIRSGRTEFSRISRLMTFNDWMQKLELDFGRTQEVNRSLALALFFLVNLMLAVIGTVWLHAKRRTEECGVRRAFGATRGRLLFDFLWRNALLATVAVVIGCIIYLNYAHSGLTIENGREYCEKLYTNNWSDLPTDLRWPDHFWSHFLVVSAVIYLIILCTVLIGTAIPALKIIWTRITEALRDE